jgi:hypothetical protein
VKLRPLAHRQPRLPGDVEDDTGDHDRDHRIGQGQPKCDQDSSQQYAQADEAVGTGVIAVRNERRAVQPASRAEPDLRGDLVAGEADAARDAERQEVVRRIGADDLFDRKTPATQALTKIASTTPSPE